MIHFDRIKNIFEKHGITEIGIIASDQLIFQKEYLLKDIEKYKSCIVFCIPYRSKNNTPDNISKYAAVYDYHLFFKLFFDQIFIDLKNAFPNDDFIGFSDHSPINERDAAIKSGLGIVGKNSMLINKKYGSYIFIGSIFSTLETNSTARDSECCINCGKCIEACPGGALSRGFEHCLSYITQKKNKNEKDIEFIKSNKYVWGCDICQDICPYNKNVQYSEIEFFEKNIINHLSSELISNMSDEEFQKRAFSWRGKKTIIENLSIFDE